MRALRPNGANCETVKFSLRFQGRLGFRKLNQQGGSGTPRRLTAVPRPGFPFAKSGQHPDRHAIESGQWSGIVNSTLFNFGPYSYTFSL